MMHAPTPTPSDGHAAASIAVPARPRQPETRHHRSSSRSFIEGISLEKAGAYHRPPYIDSAEPVPALVLDQIPRIARESRRRSIEDPHLARKEQESLVNLNRWSTSSTSSVTASTTTRRSRAGSGAAHGTAKHRLASPGTRERTGTAGSPFSSPTRGYTSRTSHRRLSSDLQREPHARSSPQRERYDPLTALPPLQTTPSLTGSTDDSPSTNPMIATPDTSTMFASDYFGQDGHLHATKKKRPVAPRNHTTPILAAPMYEGDGAREPLRRARTDERNDHDSQWQPAHSHDSQTPRRPVTREGRELDKKSTLSRALQKAKTAVLLDNAQNVEAALEAYGDACRLLQHVMDSSTAQDDKHKLEIIQITYTNRMAELRGLAAESPSTFHDKSLPARPLSEDSVAPRPISDRPAFDYHLATTLPGTVEAADLPPQLLSHPETDRNSFFTKTMQAVENSMLEDASDEANGEHAYGQSFLASNNNDLPNALTVDSAQPASAESKDAGFIPRPLALRKPSTEALRDHAGFAAEPVPQPMRSDHSNMRENSSPPLQSQTQQQTQHYRIQSTNSTSWLNTIDESISDTSSVHSISSQAGLRRKHIRGISGATDPDFDAAFDAAVEAAYDEGFEPDLDMQRRRASLERERLDAPFRYVHERMSSTVLPEDLHALTAPLRVDEHVDAVDVDEDEEEERILDSLTSDFADVRGFDFDLSSKPTPPRTSNSSGHSRSTWQSSHASTDRTTNTTTMSLSTVAEDGFPFTSEKPSHPGLQAVAGPPSALSTNSTTASSPPTTSLPPLPKLPPPSSTQGASSVRSRRLSGQSNAKTLKIETSQIDVGNRQRASTIHHSPVSHGLEHGREGVRDVDLGIQPEPTSSRSAVLHTLVVDSAPPIAAELRSAVSDSNIIPHLPDISALTGEHDDDVPEIHSARPILFRKNKSSMSLRAEHTLLVSPTDSSAPPLLTPMSATFMGSFQAKRSEDPRLSQRAQFPTTDLNNGVVHSSGIALFDTSLSHSQMPNSPRSPPGPSSSQPTNLEPCPESFLSRPFWLMRTLATTLNHPTGGFLTTRLFISREVWQTRGVKLKAMEDKVANCDLLTAALGRLAGVDTYDADAVMNELQGFEEVMERVQAALSKKLGHDVGVHGVTALFKDAPAAVAPSTTSSTGAIASMSSDTTTSSSQEKTRSKEGKENKGSYLSSWRKLRSKSSGAPLATVPARKPEDRDVPVMSSVPMTTFVPIERRGQRRDARSIFFEGPQKEYMGSLSRLFESAQILDQIARQVEDPGLKHSSATHVGLELSIRHAAEFFGFFVCRFVLADLGLLLDKYVKRGTEWVLA